MKANGTIIFCLSYLSVPLTISIIARYDEDVCIVTSNKMLHGFFKRIYPNLGIFLLRPVPMLSKNPAECARNLCRILRYKKEIHKRFDVYEDADVFFFGVAFCEFEAWLLKTLSRKNRIFYKPAISVENFDVCGSIQGIIGKLLRICVYSIHFDVLTSGKNVYHALSEKFLSGINAKGFSMEINTESISRKIMESLPEIESARILILCGGIAGVFVDRSEYAGKMDDLIDRLTSEFGHDALAIKTHPRFDEYFQKENALKKIPADIAANLILGHFDIIIGYSTAALVEAADAGKKAVSLLKLMKPIDCRVRDSYIDYLDNNAAGGIFYPAGFEDLIAFAGK